MKRIISHGVLLASILSPIISAAQPVQLSLEERQSPASAQCRPIPFGFNTAQILDTGEAYTDLLGQATTLTGNTTYIDLNQNGRPDLLASTTTEVVTLLDYNGSSFSPGPRLTLSNVRQMRAGEFNGQPGTDLAVLDGQTIRIFGNNGTGAFTQLAFFYTAGIYVSGITAGDFNSDGLLDLAWAATSSFYGMIKNLGNGTFVSNPAGIAFANFIGIETINANNDGFVDIAIRAIPDGFFNFDSIKIGRYITASGGGFSITQGLQLPNSSQSSSLVMTTANTDQYLDLAAHVNSSNNIRIYHGAPAGFPAGGSSNQATLLGSAPLRLLSSDINIDGIADLISARSGSVSILLGNGDGTYQAAHLYDALGALAHFSLLDIDADNDLDIVLRHASSGIVLLKNLVRNCE